MKKILLLLFIGCNFTFGQFTESFEGANMPAGWSIINQGSPNTWELANLSTSAVLQAQNGAGIYTIQYNTAAHNDYLVTPQFLVTAGVSDKLTFWGRSRDPNYAETISVKASSGAATAAAMTIVLQATVAPVSGPNFQKYTIDLTSFLGQTIYVGFHSTTQDRFVFDLDNVTVGGTPACIEPVSPLVFTDVQYTSANISWTAATPAPALGYDIYVSTSAVAPTAASVPTQTEISGTSATLTGLTNFTKYYVYVRSKCSASTNSVWGQLGIFLTRKIPIVPPYSYGFDNQASGYVADGWSGTGVAATSWTTNFGVGNAQAGTGLIFSNNSITADVNNRWIFSPAFQLDANNVNTITFYVRCLGASPLPAQNYRLTVGSAASAVAQTTVVYATSAADNPEWTQITATFTPTSGGVYYFGFNHIAATQQATSVSLAIDSFAITTVLGNEDFKTNQLSVYPNPVKDFLNIKTDGSNSINAIQIVDLNGRQILQKSFDNVSDTEIDVNSLSPGIYLININSGNQSVTKKFIKH